MSLSRRSLLRGLGAAAVAGATGSGLTGCDSPLATGLVGAGDPPESLTYWNLFSGADGTRQVEMLDTYRAENPEVDLTAVTLAWGNPYYTKVSLATVGGHPPDVAISHLTRMQTLARAGLVSPIDSGALERAGLTADRFNKTAWRASQIDGLQYAVPLDAHPFVTYFHTEVCEKAGLLDGDGALRPIEGVESFLETLRAAKRASGRYGLVLSTINDTATCWRLFASLYYQQGGLVTSEAGKTVELDDDATMRALELIRQISVEEELMPQGIDPNGVIVAFSGGQSGLLFDGEWNNTVYTTNKTPYDMTRFPQVFGEEYLCKADSHVFVLPVNEDRDEARLERSLGFVRSMLDQSLTWAEGGHIPAWRATETSREYRELKPQSNYADVADSIRYDDPAWYSGSGSNLEIFMGSAVSAVTTGSLTPRQALESMRTDLERQARTPSPV